MPKFNELLDLMDTLLSHPDVGCRQQAAKKITNFLESPEPILDTYMENVRSFCEKYVIPLLIRCPHLLIPISQKLLRSGVASPQEFLYYLSNYVLYQKCQQKKDAQQPPFCENVSLIRLINTLLNEIHSRSEHPQFGSASLPAASLFLDIVQCGDEASIRSYLGFSQVNFSGDEFVSEFNLADTFHLLLKHEKWQKAKVIIEAIQQGKLKEMPGPYFKLKDRNIILDGQRFSLDKIDEIAKIAGEKVREIEMYQVQEMMRKGRRRLYQASQAVGTSPFLFKHPLFAKELFAQIFSLAGMRIKKVSVKELLGSYRDLLPMTVSLLATQEVFIKTTIGLPGIDKLQLRMQTLKNIEKEIYKTVEELIFLPQLKEAPDLLIERQVRLTSALHKSDTTHKAQITELFDGMFNHVFDFRKITHKTTCLGISQLLEFISEFQSVRVKLERDLASLASSRQKNMTELASILRHLELWWNQKIRSTRSDPIDFQEGFQEELQEGLTALKALCKASLVPSCCALDRGKIYQLILHILKCQHIILCNHASISQEDLIFPGDYYKEEIEQAREKIRHGLEKARSLGLLPSQDTADRKVLLEEVSSSVSKPAASAASSVTGSAASVQNPPLLLSTPLKPTSSELSVAPVEETTRKLTASPKPGGDKR